MSPGTRDVAVIGTACLFPGAADPAAFDAALRAGHDGIRPPGEARVRQAGERAGVAYLPMGYLDRVDLFDHAFFGLSRREAELMDPQQRLLLQLTHQALEAAGHAPGRLRGSRTAVVVGATQSTYGSLLAGFDPQQILGTLPAATAARISYLLDLRGPAYVVDTACSSSLAAVAAALRELRAGHADLAVAGGVAVCAVLPVRAETGLLRGVDSPGGTCRPFDARADGTVGGEGGAVVVLKRLADALADGDTVQAVLKGAGVNHNGHRAVSMGAPSPVAQAEAISAACRDAGVDPASIGYVECHGSATPLGDVVEVDGLRRALVDPVAGRSRCAIGSVKANTGHLDGAAGMAGLVKAMLSVRHGVLYPTLHFEAPSPQLDLTEPLHVVTELTGWPDGASGPRRAGLSSFGLTGTNVHLVVEQPPAAPVTGPAGAELLTVSAKSPAALERYCRRLADFVRGTGHPLRAVAHAMNRGRDDHPYRLAFPVAAGTGGEDDPAAREALAAALGAATAPARPAAPGAPTVLLLSSDGRLDEPAWAGLCAEFPRLAAEVRAGVAELGGEPPTAAGRLVLRQHALHRLVTALGLTGARLVGSGAGNLAIRAVRGELSLADAVRAAAGLTVDAQVDDRRLRAAVQGFVDGGCVLAELAADGVLSRRIRELAPDLPVVPLIAGERSGGLLGQLYTLGATIDWDRHYDGARIARIEAPTYPFEPVRCWARPVGPPGPAGGAAPGAAAPGPGAAAAPEPAVPDAAERIASIWAAALGAEDVRADSDYFELGGTSIAGITVLRDVERELGVELRFADLYAHRTVLDLAARVEELRAAARPQPATAIAPVPRGGPLPLSYGQEQLWYLEQLNPGTPLYNLPSDLRWTGPLDRAALAGALRDLAARQEVLRSRIPDRDGEPYVLLAGQGPEPTLVDLAGRPGPDLDRELRALADATAASPFDLAAGPLWRAVLVRLAPEDHVLLVTWHHIVFDGWSPAVFFTDLAEFYRARRAGRPADLPALPVQYADFAAWQRSRIAGPRLERGLAHWRERLAGLTRPELPLDRPRPAVQDFAGGLVEFTVDADLAADVRDFSRRRGVTPFVTMLAAMNTLLHRWAGWTDVVVGVATSGRVDPATHGLVGYFNNVLPFRTAVRGSQSFADLVAATARTAVDVLDHEEVPFERIVSDLYGRRDAARHPVFDVAYTHQSAPTSDVDLPDLVAARYRDSAIAGIAPGTAKFDLTLGVVDQELGPMPGYVEYARALFAPETAARLARWFPRLLREVVQDPDRRLAEVPGPDPGPAEVQGPDRRPAEAAGPEPAAGAVVPAGPAAGAADPFVWRSVERAAAARPEHPAVVCDGTVLTYRELDRSADRLARRLVAAGVRPELPVPVVAGRGVDLVVGWLAVAKAGGAFVPVDPALPAARVATIVSDVDAAVAVVGAGWTGPAVAPAQLAVDDAGTGADDGPLAVAVEPAGLAYVCYTSGSNGRPHGCLIEHGQLAEVVRWYRDAMGIGPDDQVLQGAWPSFDTTVMEVFAALTAGATLHLADAALRDPARLLRWLAEHRITSAFLPTPIAEVLLGDGAWPAGLRLRMLSTGGDQLRLRPPAGTPFPLLNMYGPTECTIVATAGPVAAAGRVLPDIGVPLPGATAHLLDDRCRPVPDGTLGELYLGGFVVGRGYHRLPGRTAARFVADPFAARPGARMYRTGDLGRRRPDGTLEFHGRADDQLEVRGHRVEPAEVERVLAAHPRVRQALVVGRAGRHGGTQLVAHVTADGPPPDEAELTAWVAAELPGYMVPARVVRQDSLPRTVNGKLDRKRGKELEVPAAAGPRAAAGPPVAGGPPVAAGPPAPGVNGRAGGPAAPPPAERVLADLCAELLGVDRVDPRDDFFALGGDSLLGVRLGVRAARAGIHFTPRDLLGAGSLGELAAAATVTGGPPAADRPPAAAGRPVPLTPIMHGFLDALPDWPRDLVDVQVLETAAEVDTEALRAAVRHLTGLHEALRYRFRRNPLGPRIAPPGNPADGAGDADHLVDAVSLPPLSPREEAALVRDDAAALTAQLDLERGPLVRLRHYSRGPGRAGLVLLVVHHFVSDSTSSVVLLDDLDAALVELVAGRQPQGRPRPPAWREWSEHLRDMAVSNEVAAELAYWTATLGTGFAVPRLPGPGGGTGIRVVHLERVADPAAVAGVTDAEAAACALAHGLARWRGGPDAFVMMEGAAIPSPYRPADRSAAVGWFTSLHPVVLPVDPAAAPGRCLPAVADRLRSVPHDGVGYGILRHLAPASPALAALRSLPEPEVMIAHQAADGRTFDAGARLLRSRADRTPGPTGAITRRFPLVLLSAAGPAGPSVSILHDGRLTGAAADALAAEIGRAFADLAG